MALGFTPISTGALGGSPHLIAAAQTPGGALAQAVSGLTATGYIGGTTIVVRGFTALSLAPANATLGVLGSLSAKTPQMTTFAPGFGLTAALGDVVGSSGATPSLTVPAMTALLGVATGFWATTYVTGVASTTFVGTVGSGDRWVEISPSTTPNWNDVVTL